MSWVKQICLLTCVSWNLPSQTHASDAANLDVGLIEFIPLVTYENQQPGGPIFEYAQDILKAAKLPLSYHQVSINRSLEQLRNHQLDLVLTLFKTRQRESHVRYSSQPLLSLSSGFCTKESLYKKPLTLSSRIVHVRGTVLPPVFQKMSLEPVTGDKAQHRMLHMLLKGRVNAIYSPKPEVIMLTAHLEKIATPLYCYEIKNSRMPLYLGFSTRLGQQTVQKIEDALQKKIETETFDVFLRRRLFETGMPPPDIQMIDANELPQPP